MHILARVQADPLLVAAAGLVADAARAAAAASPSRLVIAQLAAPRQSYVAFGNQNPLFRACRHQDLDRLRMERTPTQNKEQVQYQAPNFFHRILRFTNFQLIIVLNKIKVPP